MITATRLRGCGATHQYDAGAIAQSHAPPVQAASSGTPSPKAVVKVRTPAKREQRVH